MTARDCFLMAAAFAFFSLVGIVLFKVDADINRAIGKPPPGKIWMFIGPMIAIGHLIAGILID